MSVFIPRVFINVTKDRIAHTFSELNICKVKNIDFVLKTGPNGFYNAAFIHIDKWFENTVSENFQNRIKNPEKEARIVYDDPWYWIVLENVSQQKNKNTPKRQLNIETINTKCLIPFPNINFLPLQKTKRIIPFEELQPIKRKLVTELDFEEKDDDDCLSMVENSSTFESLSDEGDYWEQEVGISTPLAQRDVINDDNLSITESMDNQINEWIDEEDQIDQDYNANLVTIDGRYINQLEQDIILLKSENTVWRNNSIHYFEATGLLNHQNKMYLDEINCLRNQVSILEDTNQDLNLSIKDQKQMIIRLMNG